MNGTKWDVRVLAVAGVGLLGLVAVFLWKGLQVPPEMPLAIAALKAMGMVFAGVAGRMELPAEAPAYRRTSSSPEP